VTSESLSVSGAVHLAAMADVATYTSDDICLANPKLKKEGQKQTRVSKSEAMHEIPSAELTLPTCTFRSPSQARCYFRKKTVSALHTPKKKEESKGQNRTNRQPMSR
jgi:hypothetical protein